MATALTASGVVAQAVAAQDAASTPAATPAGGIAPGDTIPPEIANATATDWPVEGRDLAQSRSVTESPIDASTVSTLAEAWSFDLDINAPYGALVANPIISGDILYLQDANSNIHALNRETGELLWETIYDESVPSGGPNGVAVGYGAIIYPVGNGTIIAADKTTGEEIWRTDVSGPMGEGVCMAPLIYDNRVWVSTTPASTVSSDLAGRRGVIHLLDITDGHLIWYFDTTTDNLWGNPSVNAGGGLWHPPAVSDDGGVYYAIGNIYPYPGNEEYPSGSSRPGDNDYANNVLQIDTETGGLIWHTNITGRDIFDLDTHLVIWGQVDLGDGFIQDLVFASGKHGFVVALDPATGLQFWRTPVGTHRNQFLQEVPEGEEIEVWPGTLGGVETPFAYHNGVVYTAVFEQPSIYSPTLLESGLDIASSVGKVSALDARNGSIIWEVDIPSGVLAAATGVNDLVFTGALDGVVRALSTVDGSVVWSAQASAGLNAPLAVSGEYLYVPAGGPLVPSAETSDPAPESQARLIAYKLA